MILTRSQTAASPVTSDLSFQDEIRKDHVAVAMIEIEGVEVAREDEEEEEKPTEEGGKYIASFLMCHCSAGRKMGFLLTVLLS